MSTPFPLGRARSATRAFLRSEASGGIALIAAAALALIVANLPATAAGYAHLIHTEIGPTFAPATGPMTTHLWINDGLMALFFLLVGLEIKREIVDGRLANPARRRLPFVAAAAGMIAPAVIFLLVAGGNAALRPGWAIPAATDIAFAMAVLALLGSRVPPSLKLLLTTIAIVDDMGAVAIIAAFYTDTIDLVALAGAVVVVAGLYGLNRRGVHSLWPYMIGFILLWLCVFRSGIHATIAGVVVAMLVPLTPSPGAPDVATSPLHRLEHALHPWVAYAILPLFAFANAGVALSGTTVAVLADPLVLGILAGLFVGKQAGILGAIALADRLGLAKPPAGVSWVQLWGMALVAGIGFTMSLFIGDLAFPGAPSLVDRVKIGVLAGSLASALAGVVVLSLSARTSPPR